MNLSVLYLLILILSTLAAGEDDFQGSDFEGDYEDSMERVQQPLSQILEANNTLRSEYPIYPWYQPLGQFVHETEENLLKFACTISKTYMKGCNTCRCRGACTAMYCDLGRCEKGQLTIGVSCQVCYCVDGYKQNSICTLRYCPEY